MNNKAVNFSSLTVETEDSFSSLLELAAEDNAESFKIYVDRDPSAIDEIGLWYGRKKLLEPRTPLMVAATYGSVRVLNLILSASVCDVNRSVGDEKTTALHCAASGGSSTVVAAVKSLIAAGADVNLMDANGRRPADVIVISPKMTELKMMLEQLLDGRSSTATSSFSNSSSSPSPTLSSTLEDEENEEEEEDSSFSFSESKDEVEKREYPIDPTLPDIKNSVYASDEFRMFSFKIRPCSRAYSHDWTECPFVHPGENARRRDPRKYHYSCVPCPDFRKGACRRGDLCEYAHGVFECWLHPAQYRTRLCKDGTGCARRVCFFAHTPEEMRPLYLSTGSAVPSPRSMDMANPFTPPMSPSGQGSSLGWPQQQSVPTLHLPQSSRLRASLSARDMHVDDVDYSMLSEFDAQARLASLAANRSFHVRPKPISPSNLDELFSAEIPCSPRYGGYDEGAVFSPSHKSAVLGGHNPMLHASLGMPSPSRMSPRNSMEQLSPLSSRVSAFAHQHEKLQQLRSLSSRELGASVGSPVSSSWSNWGSPTGKLDWGVNGEELGSLRQSLSKPEVGSGSEEPDVSWVQTLVSPPRAKGKLSVNAGGSSCGGDDDDENNPNDQVEEHAVLGAWLDQMQLDQLVA